MQKGNGRIRRDFEKFELILMIDLHKIVNILILIITHEV
jgi:hypothetical protein